MGRVRANRRRRPEGALLARRADDDAREVEPVAGEVLRLQRSGGNDAVSTMLAQRAEVEQDESEAEQSGVEQTQAAQSEVGAPGSQEDIVGGPGDSTLVIDDPIGAVPLLSSSQTDAAGREFTVTVGSSAKDPLLLAASASGRSVGTVKFASQGRPVTLKNVVISSFSTGAGGIVMSLSSGAPSGTGGSTLTMDDPIGELPLISSSLLGSSGLRFTVVVASSAKDPLLILASASGQSVGTVKLSNGGVAVVLENTLISSLQVTGQNGSNLTMTLDSRPTQKNADVSGN